MSGSAKSERRAMISLESGGSDSAILRVKRSCTPWRAMTGARDNDTFVAERRNRRSTRRRGDSYGAGSQPAADELPKIGFADRTWGVEDK